MNLDIDLSVAELLASRLCHDLVGPIGAVANGMELMADDEFGMADDALQLASNAAAQATHLLQFYRLAYGLAGSRMSGDLQEIRKLSQDMLSHGKCSLDWSAMAAGGVSLPDGAAKLLLNMIALATEGLPRGGVLSVAVGDGDPARIEVGANGQDAGFHDEVRAGLDEAIALDALTPRNVHAHFTRLVAQRIGATLQVEGPVGDQLRLSASLPGSAV